MGMFFRASVAFALISLFASVGVVMAQPTQPNPGSLISCWDMDETASTRIDHQGINNLADFNTAGYTAGLVSNAAWLVQANNEYLEAPHDSSLIPSNFTAVSFVKTSTTGQYQTILLKGGGVSNNDNTYALRFSSTNRLEILIGTGGGSDYVQNLTTANDGNWHMVAGGFSNASDVLKIVVDSTVVSKTSTITPIINNGAFSVGKSYLGGTSKSFNGQIDTVAFYNYLLSDGELSWIYNGGSGRSCEELANTGAYGTSATEYTAGLPSGGTAIVEMTMTAGDIAIVIALSLLAIVFVFSLLRDISHIASKR